MNAHHDSPAFGQKKIQNLIQPARMENLFV